VSVEENQYVLRRRIPMRRRGPGSLVRPTRTGMRHARHTLREWQPSDPVSMHLIVTDQRPDCGTLTDASTGFESGAYDEVLSVPFADPLAAQDFQHKIDNCHKVHPCGAALVGPLAVHESVDSRHRFGEAFVQNHSSSSQLASKDGARRRSPRPDPRWS
jgi:hypothetical protein